MVDDDPLPATDGEGIAFDPRLVTKPRADEAHDHVVSRNLHVAIADRDPPAGRALPGNGHLPVANDKRPGEPDCSANVEDDRARALRLDRRTERARAAVIEIGH